MLANLFRAERRRRDFRAARRRLTRSVAGLESLEPRLALAVTLVIDPSSLNLPATSSAWVAGYANVQGGKADQPFTWLASSGPNAAHFVVPPSTTANDAPLPMIQIWGEDVSGTTTITIDTSAIPSSTSNPQLAGGQLQIFVSPTNTQPSGPTLNGSITPIKNVAVTQVNSPPYTPATISAHPGMVPFDLVEFTYLPNQSSTFDLTAVNGFVVPMTLTTTDAQPQRGSTSIGTQQTGISRADIGTAFTKFMGTAQSAGNDPQGSSFKQLLYDAASSPFAAPPATPANQFFAIASPWFWIANQNNQQNATPSGLNSYWDDTLDAFFKVGNILKIDVGTSDAQGIAIEYTGTSSLVNGVSTYTFKDQSGNSVMNTVTGKPLMLPKPNNGYDAASFVFGNTLQYQSSPTGAFPSGNFPGGDGNLIINSIMESLNRGVALDGLNPTPIPISQATSTSFSIPSANANPVGVATITTVVPHGLPPNGAERVIISGVSVQDYNGTQPTTASTLTVTSPTAFTFTYNIDQIAANKSVIGQVVPVTYDTETNTTPAMVTVNSGTTPTRGQVVYLQSINGAAYDGQYTVTGNSGTTFTIDLSGDQTTTGNGGIIWSGLYATGTGGTVTPFGASTLAWNAFANWYGAPGNPSHTSQPYNAYSKFVHYSTIDGTDSRLGGTPIFINNQAYGFSLDENPNGPYTGTEVPSKFDQSIADGSSLTLTLNAWTASTPSAPTVFSIDTRPQENPPGTPRPTAPGTVTWDVLFNEPVTGVSAANFALVASAGLTGSGDIQVTPASTASAAAWTVTASTGTGSGTLGLNLANNVGSIKDASGHALAAGLTGQVYAVSEAPPVGPTASIVIPADAPNPTSAATVTFDVTFSEPVTGLSAANFKPIATGGVTGATLGPVTGSGTTYTITVNTGSGSGTLALQLLAPGTGIAPTPTGLPVTSKAYTIRQTPVAPALQSISRNLPSPTDQPQVSWTVSFSEAVAGVTAGNFSLVSTGLLGAKITQVVQAPGTGTGWTVTALTGSGAGTLRLDMVNANGITDTEGLAPTGIPLQGQSYDVERGDVPGVRIPIAFWAEPGRRANLVWPRGLVPFTGPATRELTVTLAATGGDGSFAARRDIRGVTVAGTGTGPEISLTGTARTLNAYFRTAGRLGYTPSGESLLPRVLAVSAVTTTDTLAGLDTAAILVRGRTSPGRPTIAPQIRLGTTPADTPLEITYETLLAAANVPAAATRSVEFLLGRVSTGRLEIWDGAEYRVVVPRSPRFASRFEQPLLAPGGRIKWTPRTGQTGEVPAFTLRVWDGRLKSADVSQVFVDVTAG
jgi:hypothetical protein